VVDVKVVASSKRSALIYVAIRLKWVGRAPELSPTCTGQTDKNQPCFCRPKTVRYGVVGFNVPLDTLYVISETILRVRRPNQQCHRTDQRWTLCEREHGVGTSVMFNAGFTLATKLNSTRSTLLIVECCRNRQQIEYIGQLVAFNVVANTVDFVARVYRA